MTPKDFIELLKKQCIKYVSFCFTDLLGKFHAITYTINALSPELLKDGIAFDGSSICGWKSIHKSDTLMVPDLSSFFMDPFTAEPCARVICNVFNPHTHSPYNRDPRTIAHKAEEYLKSSGIASKAYFGPELEFFVFDEMRYKIDPYGSFYSLNGPENPNNNAKEFIDQPNLAHRPCYKGGYFPTQPMDSSFDLRAQICDTLEEVGVKATLHHHEVAANQCEIGFLYDEIVKCGDNTQKYKYVVKNVAQNFAKTVTFMPKPVFGDNGSGMHVHQSLWKNGEPLFYDEKGYAQLSKTALFYIGGIIKHAKAINAFSNPTTNSYKRLIPGFEAPINLAYAAHNRSAAIRVPYNTSAKATRIEVRFPDPSANPYLAFAAMLMAGIDGIKNKIHPGEAIEKNIYHLGAEELSKIPSVSESLANALNELEKDKEFLTNGGVFTEDVLDSYIQLKREEIEKVEQVPNPAEFELYYSV